MQYVNLKIYCKPHVAKFIHSFSDEMQNKIIVDLSDNFLFSTIVRLYLIKKRTFYYNHTNTDIPNDFVAVDVYVNQKIMNDTGMFISGVDFKRMNKIFDNIFKEKLKAYVQAARLYSDKTLIDIVYDFLSLYNIDDTEIVPESVVRYLFRKNVT